MKKIITSIIALATLALGLETGLAQIQTLVSSLPIYQATDSNLASKPFIDCRGQKSVAVEWVCKHSGTATAVEGAAFFPSLDGTTWATNNAIHYDFVITPSSGNQVRWLTNFTVNGYPFLILAYITNIDADTYSTNTIRYFIKPNAP